MTDPIDNGVKILLVDDDPIILDSLGGFLRLEGYDVTEAAGVQQAIDHMKGSQFNLVITDVSMPAGDGFELLRYARAQHPETVVILLTGYGTIESAVEAIKQGAYDYLTKPVIDDDVRLAVQRSLQQQRLLAENRQLKVALAGKYTFDNIVGSDGRMAKVFDLISAVSEGRTTVLITGESGTGKSMIARAIHAHSQQRDGPFVEVSCAALPDTLLESELFGHVKGAFTHALADRMGKFAAADGGTIFLDEISSASPSLQGKLLRVLQERQFEAVGSNQTREVDVRVILATNRDLRQDVEQGKFRSDLYYRINVVNIDLPPLRDRLGDIPLLAEHFLVKYAASSRKTVHGFSPEAMQHMQRYGWPGNVRELENCVERAAVLCRSSWIGVDDLPPAVCSTGILPVCSMGILPMSSPSLSSSSQDAVKLVMPEGGSLQQALQTPEKQIIVQALEANKGSRQLTAAQLGINRTTLYKKMKKYGLMD
jgi:DNA-binding NtrC family response regulator